MLKPGGKIYIKTTCRFALYARLNRILPEGLKRRILFSFFPKKAGDGFPAFYRKCSIGEISAIARDCDLVPDRPPNKSYYSSYFSFFVPMYAVWRTATAVQAAVNQEYCERFEIVFRKSEPG